MLCGGSAYLSHCDVPELWGQWEHSEEFDLAERRFQQLVVGLDWVVGDVEVTGNAAQVCNLWVKRQKSEASNPYIYNQE